MNQYESVCLLEDSILCAYDNLWFKIRLNLYSVSPPEGRLYMDYVLMSF